MISSTLKWKMEKTVDMYEPVAKEIMKANDKVILFLREVATLNTRTKIVYPPQSTAFATPLQACLHEVR